MTRSQRRNRSAARRTRAAAFRPAVPAVARFPYFEGGKLRAELIELDENPNYQPRTAPLPQ